MEQEKKTTGLADVFGFLSKAAFVAFLATFLIKDPRKKKK